MLTIPATATVDGAAQAVQSSAVRHLLPGAPNYSEPEFIEGASRRPKCSWSRGHDNADRY